MGVCKICNIKQYNNLQSLSRHLYSKHNIKLLEYKIKYDNFIIPKCPICGKDCINKNNINYTKTCGNTECFTKYFKKKVSDGMKKAHKEGRASNIGFNHWKGIPSYPEQFFMKVIENEFEDKNYEYNYHVHKYHIDFAWVNKMLAIEIDGAQHHRYIQHIIRDKRKDEYLQNNGWHILRISWKQLFNDTKKYISVARNFIEKYDIKRIAEVKALNDKILKLENIHKIIKIMKKYSKIKKDNEKILLKIHRPHKKVYDTFKKIRHQQKENNNNYGKIWVYSDKEKKSLSINKNAFDSYISLGFIKGRKLKIN